MALNTEGSSVVVKTSTRASIFPSNERETIFSVLIEGGTSGATEVGGSVYGRSVKIVGAVSVDGPIVSRGDVRIEPGDGCVRLLGGLVVNGNLNCESSGQSVDLREAQKSSIIIKGDVAARNVNLEGAIVFGSIRAVNCRLKNCIVLGAISTAESLNVVMSSIGAYMCQEITFEGSCMMIHALGESAVRPTFAPYQSAEGSIFPIDMRYYPCIRADHGLRNGSPNQSSPYSDSSRLDFTSDWVQVSTREDISSEGNGSNASRKWVLSLGGRMSGFRQLEKSIDQLTTMLKCGFEFEHYSEDVRARLLTDAISGLNPDETWILKQVCKLH